MTFVADSRTVSQVRPAANVEARRGTRRISLLILHYTGMSSAEKAIDWLARAESQVSCHYVVDDHGAITQMVPEGLRAWHAGVSYWRGETDINSCSIGIEIQNPGHAHGYPDFSAEQMRGVMALSRDIVDRHALAPDAVLAHSDIAPERKVDPGEKFNWSQMAAAGIGLHVRAAPIRSDDIGLEFGSLDHRVTAAQEKLRRFGYDAPFSGCLDDATSKILRAFQLHFRQQRVDGRLDASTEMTLARALAAAGQMPGTPALA